MFTCMPTIVKDAQAAEDFKKASLHGRAARLDHSLAAMSFLSGIDFSKFDLDAPVGEIKTNGMQTMLRTFEKFGPNASLREIMLAPNEGGFNQMVGTADSLAGQMQEAMEEIGGDGFLITGHFKPNYVTSITDELVPALQKRGLTRTDYSGETFRENLYDF
jgi:alkanesulfonate monooxygenase SsuD/methylene tetrahydromethanopterin reductase-like flavin-dependent oxidoreductase (luciferase family)